MRLFHGAVFAALCCCTALHCDDIDNIDQQADASASNVIPVPEAQKQYNQPTQVNAVIVNKNGEMSETQYTYDPNQGGVVINNYYEVAGPDCSIYFPLWGIGFLWWSGFWVDGDGYYWDGYRYRYCNYPHWHNHWNNYWHGTWYNKRRGYYHAHGGRQGNFDHNRGMHRPAHGGPREGGGPRGGGGPHGGGPHGGGGGHGGGGHGGGHGGGGRH